MFVGGTVSVRFGWTLANLAGVPSQSRVYVAQITNSKSGSKPFPLNPKVRRSQARDARKSWTLKPTPKSKSGFRV